MGATFSYIAHSITLSLLLFYYLFSRTTCPSYLSIIGWEVSGRWYKYLNRFMVHRRYKLFQVLQGKQRSGVDCSIEILWSRAANNFSFLKRHDLVGKNRNVVISLKNLFGHNVRPKVRFRGHCLMTDSYLQLCEASGCWWWNETIVVSVLISALCWS